MDTKTLTKTQLESWGNSELITLIGELIYLLNEADEMLAPYEEGNKELEDWRVRRDSYVS